MSQSDTVANTVAEFVENHPCGADQLLPLLHRVQQEHGCVPRESMATIAAALNVSRAEVFGVVSFYEDFVVEPRGAEVQVCGAEACQALGCRTLLSEVRKRLVPGIGVREIFCLGNCAAGPSVRIGDRVLGHATLDTIRAALDTLDATRESGS